MIHLRPLAAPALALAVLLAPPPRAAAQAQAPSPAQEPRAAPGRLNVADYLDYETVSAPRISPDGRRIVYTRTWVNKQEDKWESALWIMDADGGRNRTLGKGSGAVWSPDGTRIAYLAEGEPKGTQLWVRYVDAEGAGTQVTRVAESPADLRWSPDGRSIGFSMFVPATATWKVDLPAAPAGAKWTEAPRVVERFHYRQDRTGYTETGQRHLFLVSAEGGTPRALTQGDWSVGFRFDGIGGAVGWDFSRDGRTVIVEGLDSPAADMNYQDANLYAVDAATGARRVLTPQRGTWTDPVVSPDGRMIAFAGFPHLAQTYQAGALWVMDAGGGGIRKLSGTVERDPEDIAWAPDGRGVYFTADDQGSRHLFFAPLAGGGARRVTTGSQILTLGSIARTGAAAGVRQTAWEPSDVVRIDLSRGTTTRLTRVNEDLLAGKRLGEVEEIWYPSTGGARIQGWIVKPPDFDPRRRYPLILEIHGGPHGMYNGSFSFPFQNFAANGFVVLYTNPRGSTGYGTAFGNAINRRYPGVDHEDLMVGVDTLLGRGYVDPERLYIGGCSGGGVLTSWAIGHTDRFAAASVRCPVTNWMSFLGQTDVPLFVNQFFERPFWEDPQAWLRQSPLMYVGNVKTPTLLMTGVLDLRTPMPQSEEYYAALKMRGVPTALLRFNGEYHGTSSKPSNWMRTQLYMMDWYNRYRGAAGSRPVVGEVTR